jgi:hypothetical protein
MASMEGFIDTFFQEQALRNQRRQLQVIEDNSRVQRAQVLTDLVRLTTTREGFEAIATLSLDPQFAQFAGTLDPTAQTLLNQAMASGIAAMEPEEREGVERQAAFRGIAGVSPAAVAEDQFLEQLLGREASKQELETWGRMRQAMVAGTTPAAAIEDVAAADRAARLRGHIRAAERAEEQHGGSQDSASFSRHGLVPFSGPE